MAENKPYQTNTEFDVEELKHDLVAENLSVNEGISDNDWLFLWVYQEDELVSTYKKMLGNCENVHLHNGGFEIDFYNILVSELDFKGGAFVLKYQIFSNPIFPNLALRVNEISKNKMEFRADAWTDEQAFAQLRPPIINKTPGHLKTYAMDTWDLTENNADQAYDYAQEKIKPGTGWYDNVVERAAEKGRTVEQQLLHSARWQLRNGGFEDKPKQLFYRPLYIFHEKAGTKQVITWFRDTWHDDETVIFKFPDKIDRQIRVGDEFELWDPKIDQKEINVTVNIETDIIPEGWTELRRPNFKVEVESNSGKPTEYASWEDILSGTTDTNNRVIDQIFSGSEGVDINIDYRDYSNFINFSSAKERIYNFQYKMEMVEYYASKSAAVSSGLSGMLSSSVTSSDTYVSKSLDWDMKRSKLIGTLDGWEKYMYYESHSYESSSEGEFHPATWPKTTTTKPHILLSYSSSEAQSWLTGSIDSSSLYDENNMSILRKTIPMHVQQDSNNAGYVLFVDMIAQHFDILYNYIDNFDNQIHRDEDVSTGMSKDLLFTALQSYGWKPESGLDLNDIWTYFLGTDSSGSYQTTSSAEFPQGGDHALAQPSMSYVQFESIPTKDLEAEPWTRIFNNLPFLLKTKGSMRGLKALLSCYGIPASFFRIQEFGGPDPARNVSGSHLREIDMLNHSLNFQPAGTGSDYHYESGSFVSASFIQTGGSSTGNKWANINTLEMRFKPDGANLNPNAASMSLFTLPSTSATNHTTPRGGVVIERSGSTKYGWVSFWGMNDSSTNAVSGSTGKLPIFDGDWWNLMLRRNETLSPDTTTLSVQKAPDHAHGRISHAESVDIEMTGEDSPYVWSSGRSIRIGSIEKLHYFKGTVGAPTGSTSGANRKYNGFCGWIQEFKLWTEEIEDWVFDAHTKAPTSMLGNTYTSSYDNLWYRLPFGTDNNLPKLPSGSEATMLSSTHGDQTNLIFTEAFVTGSTFDWDEQEEVYYVGTPNSIGLNPTGNKIRVEDNTINGVLDPFQSQESSSSDTNPIDLPDLYVSLSPQDDLDLDIALQFGQLELDDIVGDPRDARRTQYTQLKTLRDAYYKKFAGPQNLQAFLRMISYFNTALFDQIEKMLPARGTNIVGLLIKPTLLERPKTATEASFSFDVVHYPGKAGDMENMPHYNYDHYTQSIRCIDDERYMSGSDDYDAMVYVDDEDDSTSQFSILTDTIKANERHDYNQINGMKYTYDIVTKQHGILYDGRTFTREGVMPFVSSSRTNKTYKVTEYQYGSIASSSRHDWSGKEFFEAEINPYNMSQAGPLNLTFRGCRMSAADFNVDSLDTVDGGPVVEFIEGNPNTLISVKPSFKGDLDVR